MSQPATSRWLHAARATTTLRSRELRVIGAVPANALRRLAVA